MEPKRVDETLPQPELLDCSFRDGGYYNNWDFSDELFAEYLSVLRQTSVNFLEVGFRLPAAPGFRGAHAYTTDAFLSSFEIPSEKRLGVMINAADLAHSDSLDASLAKLFAPSNESPIDFVRIASHVSEIARSREIAKKLIDMGYNVAINLMQISEIESSVVSGIASRLSDLPLLALYVADSLGSMKPETIEATFDVLSDSTDLPLGLHAHDNLGLAHQNSMVAIQKGARFVDGTMRGIGRGPGNTKTEELAIALHRSEIEFEGALRLGRFSDTTWAELQKRLGWGRNLAYFAAGLLHVHPTYVQELLADSRHDESSTLRVVRNLSMAGAQRFDKDKLIEAERPDSTGYSEPSDFQEAEDWQPGGCEQAVILGPGPSLQQYRRTLSIFVTQNPEALILSVNDADLNVYHSNAYRVISHRRQVEPNAHFFSEAESRIILPQKRLSKLIPTNALARCFNVDFVNSVHLEFEEGVVRSPVNNVFAYAFGLAQLAGVKRLFIAGFDGIGGGDSRDFEMVEILNEVRKSPALEIWSLTPTKLPIETVSPLSPPGPKNES